MKTTEELIQEYLAKGGKVTTQVKPRAEERKFAPFMQTHKSR